jgi:biotin-dependent carboxylase-like uncharacterized protein
MGSRSTYVKSQLGGLNGRPLHAGDRLMSGKTNPRTLHRKLPSQYIPKYQNQSELRVMLGPQDDYFTEKGIHTFFNSEYTISLAADRAGYRLQGQRIEHKIGADIISDGIPPGAIQVPGNGLPIILLADRHTTGGYTKIATVITADLPWLAQAQPGYRVTFKQISESDAHHALREYEQKISTIRKWIQRENNGDTAH